MCGITGIINFKGEPVSREILESMNSNLIHRGPDADGYYFSDGDGSLKAGLGMRRLSIIDLDTGNQPIYSEDRNTVTVFNGEIYNFRELKEELEAKGHKFYTKTDTEVIVHLWEEYGPDLVGKLNGMFAIALWDARKGELFLVRDRVGQKPLYYMQIKNSFYFSSEIKTFLEIPEFKKEVNRKAIHYYLTYQYIPAPMTIWKGVKALKAANFMRVGSRGIKEVKRYWDISYKNKTELTFAQSKEKIRELLKDATAKRMIADVPLGAFLSGGHDSSIIVGLMSEISPRPVKTFSIGFEEEEFSELKYAKIIADRFNTEHHEFVVKPDFKSLIPDIVRNYSQPYADCSALPSYYIAKMTREHVKVALNGDAGDENYAGYLRYRALKLAKYLSPAYKLIPGKLEELLFKIIPMNESVDSKSLIRYFHRFAGPLKEEQAVRNIVWHAYFTNEQKSSIYSEEMKEEFKGLDSYRLLRDLFNNAPADTDLDRAMYADIMAYLPDDLMVKMDIASMANSLETRSPFLDYRLIEFNAALPDSWKLKGFNKSKYILKEAFKDYFPPEIMKRRKQGFSIPLGRWFRGDWQGYLKDVILSASAAGRGYFKPDAVRQLVDEHTGGRADHGYRLWALLMLELWHRRFVD